jgi:hypothetical protein
MTNVMPITCLEQETRCTAVEVETMLSMKHWMPLIMRRIAVMVLAGCLALAFLPLGCASSIGTASLRYRKQHQNDDRRLPDMTIERLQECVETYGEQLGPLDPPLSHAKGHVQVTPEGEVVDIQLTGIPDSAPDFAACVRITLRDMTVPASVLSLRQKETPGEANEQTVLRGNEVGNPMVLVELGAALAEFVAQHKGRIVLYTVTIEVLGAAAVVATQEMLKKKNNWRKKCTDGYVNCIMSPTGWGRGNTWNESRCGTCRNVCDANNGSWPPDIEMFPEGRVSCN